MACVNGCLTCSITLPLSKPSGMGPYSRESLDTIRLSPSTHMWPGGT